MTTLRPSYSGHLSTVYSATANSTDLPLWGRSTNTQFGTAYWGENQIVPQSGCTFETDETVVVEISLLSGMVISGKVYTNSLFGPIISSTIVGGKLRFTLPPDTVAWAIVNNVLHLPIRICARPILAVPGGVITYDGSQTAAFTGQTLYFPAGTHTIPIRFPIHQNAHIFLHRDAWIVGSFQALSDIGGHSVRGYGVISGEWGESQRAWIRTRPYAEAITYALLYGPFALSADATVYGVTLLDPPFYTTAYGFNVWDRVDICAPWWGNANGIFSAQRYTTGLASITKCAIWTHDDSIDFSEYGGAISTSENIICALSASFVVSYWPFEDQKKRHVSTNDTIVCINYWIPGVGSIILVWSDGGDHSTSGGTLDDARAQVTSGVTFTGTRFMGDAIYGMVFDLQNYPYPYGEILPGEQLGQIRDFVFENITIESVPFIKFDLKGKDRWNTPHDIRFNNVVIGGTLLTVANFDTFFNRNEFPYNIFVNGQPLTDAPTTTGSWYLTDVTMTPWDFTPQSGRLGGSQALQLPQQVSWAGSYTPSRGVIPSIGTYNWAISIPSGLDLSYLFSVTGSIGFQAADSIENIANVVLTGTTLMTPVSVINASMGVELTFSSQFSASSTPLSANPFSFAITGQVDFGEGLPLNYSSFQVFSIGGAITLTPEAGGNAPSARRRFVPWWGRDASRNLLAALARVAGRRS